MSARVLLLVLLVLPACSTIKTQHRDWSHYTGPGAEYFSMPDPPPVQSLPDPGEPTNRAFQNVNVDLLNLVVQPLAYGWRAVTTDGIRSHIVQFGTNLAWPVRLVSNVFQARWSDAGTETARFAINTTVGLLGFFDPASSWGIEPPPPQDTGLMLGTWGWTPQFYVMLPAVGPSSDRDSVGFVGDTVLDPASYLFFPLSVFLKFNQLSDHVDTYLRLNEVLDDSYSIVRQVWTLYRSQAEVNMQFESESGPSIDTLEAVFLSYRDPEFPRQADVRTIVTPTTGRELPYDLWLQPGAAPIVYILPGLASHRESDSTLALAEMVWANGYSAVTVSSALNREFMTAGSTLDVPGYAPVDAHDMHRCLTAIDKELRERYPDRLTQRALLGLSMGAFHMLYIAAANEGADTFVAPAFATADDVPLLEFDAYVPINPPVRLRHGVEVLDAFYRSPLAWPEEGREERITNILLKVLQLARADLRPGIELPFDRIEARYLVGLTFRVLLRDILFDSQSRHDMGVLLTPLDPRDRQPAYDEINTYSWMEYFYAFALPYLRGRDEALGDPQVLWDRCDLHPFQRQLAGNASIHVFTNRNDFLLADEDLAWLEDTFGTERLQFFDYGGHLGNLYRPDVQAAIMDALGQALREASAATSLDLALSTGASRAATALVPGIFDPAPAMR